MVEMSDLEPGMKVRIVSTRDTYDGSWNAAGEMDHWLGQVMTVRSVDVDTCKMEEDIDDRSDGEEGWFWYPQMIECIVECKDTEFEPNESLDDLLIF